jgi:hypothetical protein
MDEKPRTCVIVSYWIGQPAKNLHRLLAQMQRIDAGAPYDILIVCNGGLERPLTLPARFDALRPRVIHRENSGYNLGAWECGWTNADGYEYFLFIQDDCFLKRPNWVSDFEFRMSHDAGIGLLGESIAWDQATWSFLREATDRDLGRSVWPDDEPVHPIDAVMAMVEQHGIPLGEVGTHVQSLIFFTSRRVLTEVGGIQVLGTGYRGACASEVGFSRLIESRGYRVSKVAECPFVFIGHRQWTNQGNKLKVSFRWRVSILLKRLARGGNLGAETKRFFYELQTGQLPGTGR